MRVPDRRALRRTGICSQRNPRTTMPTAAATSADIRDLRFSAVANSAMSNTHPPTSSGVQRFIREYWHRGPPRRQGLEVFELQESIRLPVVRVRLAPAEDVRRISKLARVTARCRMT